MIELRQQPLTLDHAKQWLTELAQLVTKEKPFVLVYPPIAQQPSSEDTESRKQIIIWLKHNQKEFRKYCKGFVLAAAHNNPNAAAYLALTASAANLEKVYRVSVHVSQTLASARQQAQTLFS